MFVRKAATETTVLLHRETIQKHGSHDQKTHGRGGKGGGESSTSPQARQNRFTGEQTDEPTGVNPFTGKTKQQDIDDAKEDLDNNILGAKKVLDNAKNANTANNARGTIKGFKDVKSALGDKKKMDKVRLKRDSLATRVKNNPLAAFDNTYTEDIGYINAATSGLSRYGNL